VVYAKVSVPVAGVPALAFAWMETKRSAPREFAKLVRAERLTERLSERVMSTVKPELRSSVAVRFAMSSTTVASWRPQPTAPGSAPP